MTERSDPSPQCHLSVLLFIATLCLAPISPDAVAAQDLLERIAQRFGAGARSALLGILGAEGTPTLR